MGKLPEILPQPELPSNLPDSAIWLSGEGAGSWFVVNPTIAKDQFHISRYAPSGALECEGLFSPREIQLDLNKDFQLTYPSFCNIITIKQGINTITLAPL